MGHCIDKRAKDFVISASTRVSFGYYFILGFQAPKGHSLS